MSSDDDKLLQQIFVERDPSGWQLLVGCILLNHTARKQVDRIWPELFDRYPTNVLWPRWDERGGLEELLAPLGLQHRRLKLLANFSYWWNRHVEQAQADEVAVNELIVSMTPPAVGEYARDSWILFKMGPDQTGTGLITELQSLNLGSGWPEDKELKAWMKPVFAAASLRGSLHYDVELLREAWKEKLES